MTEIQGFIIKTIITTFAVAVIIWIKDTVKKEKVYDKALKALAHDSFHRQCRKILDQEKISEDDLENLNCL